MTLSRHAEMTARRLRFGRAWHYRHNNIPQTMGGTCCSVLYYMVTLLFYTLKYAVINVERTRVPYRCVKKHLALHTIRRLPRSAHHRASRRFLDRIFIKITLRKRESTSARLHVVVKVYNNIIVMKSTKTMRLVLWTAKPVTADGRNRIKE